MRSFPLLFLLLSVSSSRLYPSDITPVQLRIMVPVPPVRAVSPFSCFPLNSQWDQWIVDLRCDCFTDSVQMSSRVCVAVSRCRNGGLSFLTRAPPPALHPRKAFRPRLSSARSEVCRWVGGNTADLEERCQSVGERAALSSSDIGEIQ